ncbi:MAG: phosphatidylserine/phosphatidylglycerophosphate/cardiolipin synthase family protein [Rhodococcus sp. (in: high G+C Gram-positive bacteria)]|uniref:phosphatidylserine/phosphatidylglycerophosphate/ cardiolipin synthase family protein n=1 Tax=Rhodococcus sp. TaxID=1831 RepID=UPI003BB68C48
MGTSFHAPHPWPHITTTLRGPGPRHVAIAHLDHTAPDLLPLRAGDVLIVNAARNALRAHATSPTALAQFVENGVRVLSTPNLHTGVLVTPDLAILGPVSASRSSTLADEAALITDDPDTIAAARRFIDNLDDLTDIDQTFLDNATTLWQIGRSIPLPGIGAQRRAQPDFLPTTVTRMFLRHITNYTPSTDEQQQWADITTPGSSTAGPVSAYPLEWLRLDTPDDRDRFRRGDVLIQITADNTWIHPPAVIHSDPIRLPHTRHAIAYQLRARVDLDPLPVPDAATMLADLGHPNPRLRTDHRIISPTLRAAFLRLWNL